MGREFDLELIAALPPGVDPCGERGEFHSFAYHGPLFQHPVPTASGEVIEREGFVFADLMSADETTSKRGQALRIASSRSSSE